MPTKPVLVTGASGFLGGHVCERLAAAGYRVRAFVRPASASPDRTETAYGDVTDAASVRSAAAGCHSIVHCAALFCESGNREPVRAVNVRGMQNTLDAGLAAGVERFVEISTVGVYGMRHQIGADETTPRCRSGDAYADSKIEAEEVAFACHAEHGLPLVVLRPGVIFGPRDRHFLPRLAASLESGRFRYIRGGGNLQTLVYVKNVADAVLQALRRPEAVGQAFTITEPVRRTTREVVDTVARLLGIPAPTKSVPASVAWTFGYASELVHRALRCRTAPFASRAALRFNVLSRHFETRKAAELLGYRPDLDFEGNLKLAVDWLKSDRALRETERAHAS